MKIHVRSVLLALSCVLFLALLPGRLSANDNSEPISLFGGALTVHDSYFTWEGATDDGVYRHDVYRNSSNYSIEVTSMLEIPTLALVTGTTDGSDVIAGHLDIGEYRDNSGTLSGTGTYWCNGHAYSSMDGTYEYDVNLATGELRYAVNQTFYFDAGWVDSGTYHYVSEFDGSYQWTQAHSGSNNAHWSPASGESSISLFDVEYVFSSGSSWWGYEKWGNSLDESGMITTGGWTDYYTHSGGGVLYISENTNSDTGDYISISGWDQYVGDFSAESYPSPFAGLGTVTWADRTGPSFLENQLWVKQNSEDEYTLVNWQSGSMDSSGNVTDYYVQGDLTLTITGNPRTFDQYASTATVDIDGSAGYCDANQYFWVSGWDVSSIPPEDTTYNTPFFTGTSKLWVNGSVYSFYFGVKDWQGNRADRYDNESAGTLMITGSESNDGDVTVSYHTISASGEYTDGHFNVGGLNVSVTSPDLGGPDGIWFDGNFYRRGAPTGNDRHKFFGVTTGDYGMMYPSSDGGTINYEFHFYETSCTGSFAAGTTGLFFVPGRSGSPAPMIPANWDGTLLLSSESAPEDMPPAIRANGVLTVFVGTATDPLSPSVTTAFYAVPTVSAYTPWLLRVRSDGTVHFMDYTYGEQTGSYNLETHLFQGNSADFPVLLAVSGASENHQAWQLPEPPEGLPASFLIGYDVWRFRGLDENGMPIYQGYYNGQTLSVGGLVNGTRAVTVTDPVNGNTTGILSDARGVVKLVDGRLAYSGDFEGARITPTPPATAPLNTITGDVDITGNVLSLGAMLNDASMAGATWQYMDDGTTATLQNALAGNQLRWVWTGSNNGVVANTPSMILGGGNLRLPSGGDDDVYGVVLGAGSWLTSNIPGKLNVRENAKMFKDLVIGGDLTVTGNIKNNFNVLGPITSVGSTVITENSGDSRYLRVDSTDPVALVHGATITGATQLNGALSTTGAATFNAATFKEDLTVESNLVIRGAYDGPPADRKVIMQADQKLLIPESGDISMGAFRAGPLPDTVP